MNDVLKRRLIKRTLKSKTKNNTTIKETIHFANAQWRVTDWGLAAEKIGLLEYYIEASWLLEAKRGAMYDWPCHMAEKPWVDIEAFIEAFIIALEVHKGRYKGNVNPQFLALSLAKARETVRRRPAWRSDAILCR